jgi:hypothetical protein
LSFGALRLDLVTLYLESATIYPSSIIEPGNMHVALTPKLVRMVYLPPPSVSVLSAYWCSMHRHDRVAYKDTETIFRTSMATQYQAIGHMHWIAPISNGGQIWSTIIIEVILPVGTLIHATLHNKLTISASLGTIALDVARTGARMLFCDCAM